MEHAHKHRSWVVMDSRFREMLRCETSAEAYAWREDLSKEAKRAGRMDTQFTVSYLPSPFSIKSQTLLGPTGTRITYLHERRKPKA